MMFPAFVFYAVAKSFVSQTTTSATTTHPINTVCLVEPRNEISVNNSQIHTSRIPPSPKKLSQKSLAASLLGPGSIGYLGEGAQGIEHCPDGTRWAGSVPVRGSVRSCAFVSSCDVRVMGCF